MTANPSRRAVAAALLATPFAGGPLVLTATWPAWAQTPPPPSSTRLILTDPLARRALELLDWSPSVRDAALEFFRQRGEADAIPALVQALRFTNRNREPFFDALVALAGENPGDSWFAWQRWIERNPQVTPFAGYVSFKAALYARIDPNFLLFLRDGVRHEIRIEEIVWGGVAKDGIPALTNPARIPAAEQDYLTDEELVFGVEINGDARAYPLRIMDWHEMFNDVVGGVPVSLAYCTLCASGVLFETTVQGREAPFVFGSSGFLYRSNKLMYDQETNSLWNQFTGRPVVGRLTGSGIELATRPVAITTWADWRDAHPLTTVLSLDTGFERDYEPGRPYGRYFASPELMFPADLRDASLDAKALVFALRGAGAEVAWPLERFEGGAVINDRAGLVPVTLIGRAETRTVRAYRTDGRAFSAGGSDRALVDPDGGAWRVTEAALEGQGGERFTRLPGHIAYWFAWSGYLGEEGRLAAE